mmetsp:Transcript_3603/g.6809  ORF Transcript_3603/g.6809 Transcript_3603/m.6809 type:complete len:101 (+) Transcript_3603:148-450(+)
MTMMRPLPDGANLRTPSNKKGDILTSPRSSSIVLPLSIPSLYNYSLSRERLTIIFSCNKKVVHTFLPTQMIISLWEGGVGIHPLIANLPQKRKQKKLMMT